tara:strand:- start:168 stop:425 length:258 start_codon:yes stop_codon:yes gene_type:complete
MTPKVIYERSPYRYVECGSLRNGFPDYRIQKYNDITQKYQDIYLLDSSDQLDYAIEDFEYTKWLDPDGIPCYKKDEHSEQTLGDL